MRLPSNKVLGSAAAALALFGVSGFYLAGRPVAVRTVKIEDNVRIRVFGLGTMEAQVISKVGFEVGAALVELKTDHGDRVRKGDVLARLHDAEQVAKVAKAKAAVSSAETAIRKGDANVAKAKSILAQKSQVNRRRQELAGRQTVSVQTAEEAQKDEEVAQADLAVAVADVDVLKANLEDVRSQHRYEQIILEHHELLAPFDAIVVERSKEAGSVVKAGDPIFTLVAPETVWILAHIDESRSGQITLGQRAEVRFRSLPQKIFQGRVIRIGIESDRVSEERRVWVSCHDCPADFYLGEQAEVLITIGTVQRGLLVPEAAVQGYDGAKGRVWTVENGRLARRTVSFGYRTEDAKLEIKDKLPDGVSVVGEPGQGLVEGRSARLAVSGAP